MCRYCILGFCSMMNVFRIMNSFDAVICPTPFQSWEGSQNPIPFISKKSPFSSKGLVWMSEICHGGQNKVNVQFYYVPYVHILKFLEGEWSDTYIPMECNVYKNFSSQTNVKQPIIKNHFGHMWQTFMALTFSIF